MYPRLIIRKMLDGESVMLSNTRLRLGFLCISIIHLKAHFCCFSWYTHFGRYFRFENALCHLVAALFEILKQVRVLLKSTGRHIDSPVENHAKKDIFREEQGIQTIIIHKAFGETWVERRPENKYTYLWISGLFLGFIVSFSAAFLWYNPNRSFRVNPDDWKCWATFRRKGKT